MMKYRTKLILAFSGLAVVSAGVVSATVATVVISKGNELAETSTRFSTVANLIQKISESGVTTSDLNNIKNYFSTLQSALSESDSEAVLSAVKSLTSSQWDTIFDVLSSSSSTTDGTFNYTFDSGSSVAMTKTDTGYTLTIGDTTYNIGTSTSGSTVSTS